MDVLPAIDIYGGKCVRLLRGDFAQATAYADDPVAQARIWAAQGARWLHLVDLDGAAGRGDNGAQVAAILKAVAGARVQPNDANGESAGARAGDGDDEAAELRVQVGGGVRSLETVRKWLDAGAERVVLGTAAVQDPQFLERACQEAPGRVVLALDHLDGRVRVKGWAQEGPPVEEVLARVRGLPLAALLCTDVGRDGTLAGAGVDATAAIGRAQPHPVLLSGGVGSLQDLRDAAATGCIAGAVCGKALYENRFSLREALAATGGESS